MANSVDPDQTALIGAVCSGSTLFAFILNSLVMSGNYLQQTTSADDIYRYFFSWRFKGYNIRKMEHSNVEPTDTSKVSRTCRCCIWSVGL